MVIAISIAFRQEEGQSPGSLTDFIPHPIDWLSVEDALSLGAGLSALGAWQFHRHFYNFLSLTSCLLTLRTEVCFRCLPVILLQRRLGFPSILYPLSVSHSRLRFYCSLSPCQITQQTGIFLLSISFSTR